MAAVCRRRVSLQLKGSLSACLSGRHGHAPRRRNCKPSARKSSGSSSKTADGASWSAFRCSRGDSHANDVAVTRSFYEFLLPYFVSGGIVNEKSDIGIRLGQVYLYELPHLGVVSPVVVREAEGDPANPRILGTVRRCADTNTVAYRGTYPVPPQDFWSLLENPDYEQLYSSFKGTLPGWTASYRATNGDNDIRRLQEGSSRRGLLRCRALPC